MSSRVVRGVLMAATTAIASAQAADCAAPFTAYYDVQASRGMLALEGDATIEFGRSGADYTVKASMNASGLMSSRQESRGAVGDGVLIPVHYSESSSRRGKASTTIDWRERRVTFADGAGVPPPVALQDRASLMVQLAASWRARPAAAVLEFPVASLRRISTFRFVRRGSEKLDLPGGAVEAERFERTDENGEDRLEVWLAPSSCAVPVRIRLRDHRGHDIDQRLRELRFE